MMNTQTNKTIGTQGEEIVSERGTEEATTESLRLLGKFAACDRSEYVLACLDAEYEQEQWIDTGERFS